MRPPTTTITLGIQFIDTRLCVLIGFKYIIVIGSIIFALIGLVYGLSIVLITPQLYDTITLEIELIGIVFNGIITIVSVLIGIASQREDVGRPRLPIEFAEAIASIIGNIIGYVIGFECGLIVPALGIKTIVKYDFVGAVYNGIILLLSVTVGLNFITVIALLLAILNGLIYGVECGTIISLLSDIITAKCGFISMIFDIVCNGINAPLYKAIGIEFTTVFNGLIINLIGYTIGLLSYLKTVQIGGILAVVSKETEYLNSDVTRVQVLQKQRKQELETRNPRVGNKGSHKPTCLVATCSNV